MAGEAELIPLRNISTMLGVTEGGIIGRKSIYPRNNRVAIIGDSIAYNNVWPSALEVPANAQCRYMAHGPMTWAAYLSRQRFSFERVNNFGIPGNDTYDIIGGGPNNVPDRLGAALLASDAATWVLQIGTNDLIANYDEAATIANLTTIITRILDADRAVVVVVPMPRDGGASGTLTATQKLRIAAIRKWLLAQRQTDRFFVVDPWEYMVDRASATGAPKAGMTYDGLHPAQIGAYWCGYALARFFGLGFGRGYFPYVDVMNRSNIDVYNAADNPGGCLSPNPQLLGTGGAPGTGGTGTVADSWAGQLGGAGVTRAYSKVTCADGEPAQQVVFGGTAGADGDHWALLNNPVASANLAIGDVVEGYADVEVDAGTAAVPAFGVAIMVNSGLLRVLWGDFTSTTKALSMPPVAHAGVMKTPRLTLTDTAIRFGFFVYTANGASPALTARIRGIELRKVLAA